MTKQLSFREKLRNFLGLDTQKPEDFYRIVEKNNGECIVYKHYYEQISPRGSFFQRVAHLGRFASIEAAKLKVEQDKEYGVAHQVKQEHIL